MRNTRFVLFLLAGVFGLSACSGLSQAVIDAAKAAYTNKADTNYQAHPLKPDLTYLEARTPNASALLVLGYVDQRAPTALPLESWFSGEGDVLRTQGGLMTSSSGQPEFWQNTSLTFDAQVPKSARFDLPAQGLYGLEHRFKGLATVPGNATPLMQRAARLPGIVFTAYVSTWANPPQGAQASKWLAQYGSLNHVVGKDPASGQAIYGLHCLRADFCVEYLRRTAAQNL